MPFWLFNYPTTTTNTTHMLMRKNDRIPDTYLQFQKPNLKKVSDM